MSEEQSVLAYRLGNPDDHGIVYDTFLRGLYFGNPFYKEIAQPVFFENYKPFLKALLDKKRAALVVACLVDDPSTIVGYSLMSADLSTVHWVYVKSNWRRFGIAKKLVPKNFKYYSHYSKLGKDLLKKYPEASFNPFKV